MYDWSLERSTELEWQTYTNLGFYLFTNWFSIGFSLDEEYRLMWFQFKFTMMSQLYLITENLNN